MKTLSNLRTTTRFYLDEVSAADWSDMQIDTQLNFRYLGMYAAVVETYEDYYRTTTTQDFEANVAEYSLPSDMYKLKRLEAKYASTDERRKVTPVDFNQFILATDTTSYQSTNKPICDLSGTKLRVLPVPTSDLTDALKYTYIAEGTELVEDTDTINIPFADRYANYICLGAAGDLLRKGQQEEATATRYIAEYEVALEKMKQELEDRDGGVKMILDTQGDDIDFSAERISGYTFS